MKVKAKIVITESKPLNFMGATTPLYTYQKMNTFSCCILFKMDVMRAETEKNVPKDGLESMPLSLTSLRKKTTTFLKLRQQGIRKWSPF